VKSVNQEVDEFLGVLLVVTPELIVDSPQNLLEAFGHHNLIGVPHLLHHAREGEHEFALVTQPILNIELAEVAAIHDIVLVQQLDVDQALQG